MKDTESESEKGSTMYGNAAHNIYAQNNVGIESPSKLIEMLYEGVLRFNAQAKKALRDGDVQKRIYWTNRSIAIITELISVLDPRGGQIAAYLNGLYNYEIHLLSSASSQKSEAKYDEVSKVFKTLLETWRESVSALA